MKRKSVESSNLASVGYDAKGQILEIELIMVEFINILMYHKMYIMN